MLKFQPPLAYFESLSVIGMTNDRQDQPHKTTRSGGRNKQKRHTHHQMEPPIGFSSRSQTQPAASQETFVGGIASIGQDDWRISSCENVPEGCCARNVCESANAM